MLAFSDFSKHVQKGEEARVYPEPTGQILYPLDVVRGEGSLAYLA